MKNIGIPTFLDLQNELQIQKIHNRALQDDLEVLRSPHFRPEQASYVTKLKAPPPKVFFNLGSLRSGKDTAALQSGIIENCIAQMQMAVLLIEAQTALAKKDPYSSAEIIECAKADARYFKGIEKSARYMNKELSENPSASEVQTPAHASGIDHIAGIFFDAVRGQVQRTLLKMEPQDLVKKIYQARMDFAQTAIELSDLYIAAQTGNFEDAVHIKTGLSRGLISSTYKAHFEKAFVQKTQMTAEGISITHSNIMGIQGFLAQVYEMGDDACATQVFTPKRYEAVSLTLLTQFAP